MLPEAFNQFFTGQQEILWLLVVFLDLGATILMYRIFGKSGLYAVIVLNIMLCNVMGPKIVTVFGLNTTMGAIIYSGIYFATDLLGERYGRREANRAVFLGFSANVGLVIFTQLSLLFVPTDEGNKAEIAHKAHEAQEFLFNMTPRFVFGSLLAYIISQAHDVWMYHLLKNWTRGRHLWIRNNVSTMLSQAIDTTIYALVVWWGLVDLKTALALGAAKYFFKCLIALLDTPFLYWARTWELEHRDWNDDPATEAARFEEAEATAE